MIDREAIERLVPHAGSMCLLDGVLCWDERHVVCHSRSHLDPANPLRGARGLAAIHAVEYAAQAMAVHRGLLRPPGAAGGAPGYLAALRDVVLGVERLDAEDETLRIEARRLASLGGSLLYGFDVRAGDTRLAGGRATVVAAAERS